MIITRLFHFPKSTNFLKIKIFLPIEYTPICPELFSLFMIKHTKTQPRKLIYYI